MNLDKSVLEISSVIERSAGMESYTLVPMLLREEVGSIVLRPVYKYDDKGFLLSTDFEYEVFANEKKKK